jgi:hypothetical protein
MKTLDDLSPIQEKPFCEAVSTFEELMAQGGPAFLLGAGSSKCAGLPLTTELTEQALGSNELDSTSKDILTAIREVFAGARTAHIEDYLSELIDLLAIADRRAERGAMSVEIELAGKRYIAAQLREAADRIKRAIAETIGKKIRIGTHRSFITAVHRPLRPGKMTPGQVVDYLVLNYDTAIEDALALEKVPFSDGIDGGVTGWWNPQTFDRDGLAARVLKLHGSINWIEVLDDPLPRRIAPNVQGEDSRSHRILIWPASTKYRETQRDPYAQLADRARRAMRPGNGFQRVLVICGYGFGDAHINIEVDRAIRESGGDLTVVAFTSEDEPVGQLKQWIEDIDTREQVLIYTNRGFFHGDYSAQSDCDLMWWKFENLTRMLGGEL